MFFCLPATAQVTSTRRVTMRSTARTCITTAEWDGGLEEWWILHVIWTAPCSHSTRNRVASCSRAGLTARLTWTFTTPQTSYTSTDLTTTVCYASDIKLLKSYCVCFLPHDAQYARRGITSVSCLSVRLSVGNVNISWPCTRGLTSLWLTWLEGLRPLSPSCIYTPLCLWK